MFQRARLVITLGAILCMIGCSKQPGNGRATVLDSNSADDDALIIKFCADCHTMPDPASFPKSAWHDEVKRGYTFYYDSGRTDLQVPISNDTLRYFVSRAPEHLELPTPDPIDSATAGQFTITEMTLPEVNEPAVSFVDFVDLGKGLGRGILISEMRGGGIYFLPVSSGAVQPAIEIARVHNPAVVRVTDWNLDGLADLVVADLGSFLPEDHDKGRVVLFLRDANSESKFVSSTLVDQVGRVASVELADLDSNGTTDILVAEFGWQKTGSIFWLKRDSSTHHLVRKKIDTRSGTIHLPTVDLDQDGDLDFVALISQQYEQIVAFINDGFGNFVPKGMYEAPEPSFGSSGIALADVNADGKIDVIYTNGDSFDSFVLKPSHGLRWLENRDGSNFSVHELTKMPGAHRGLIGNVLGDEQPEIVASAFIPQDLLKAQSRRETEGLTVLEPRGDGGFIKHVLSTSNYNHAAMVLADLNEDGMLEIILGCFREKGTGPAAMIWQHK